MQSRVYWVICCVEQFIFHKALGTEEGGSRTKPPQAIIMAENATVKVYKRERTLVERVIGKYENGKTKMVTLKQWNKKCGLCVGKQSSAGDTFIYDSGIELPFEEMEELADVMPTMSKLANAVNYAELGNNKDSAFGYEYRTILKSSEFGGLKICRMKKSPTPIDFAVTTPQEDENVDPSPSASTTTTAEKSPYESWTECWDKFYINRNDDWKKIGNILRDFCCAAHAELNNSQPEGIDIVPPTPPATPSSVKVPLVATVKVPLVTSAPQKKRKGKETKKTPKKSKISSEEEEEIICSEVRKKKFFFYDKYRNFNGGYFFFSKIQ